MGRILKVIDLSMKRIILLLPVLLAACSSTPNPSDYSFELTDNLITSSIEIDDDTTKYSDTCYRKGVVEWKVDVKPKDFTGIASFKGHFLIGDKGYRSDSELVYLRLKNGKMLPLDYFFRTYTDSVATRDKKEWAICSIKSATDFALIVDKDTLIMTPGVHPLNAKD